MTLAAGAGLPCADGPTHVNPLLAVSAQFDADHRGFSARHSRGRVADGAERTVSELLEPGTQTWRRSGIAAAKNACCPRSRRVSHDAWIAAWSTSAPARSRSSGSCAFTAMSACRPVRRISCPAVRSCSC